MTAPRPSPSHQAGLRHLRKTDPILKAILAAVGPCRWVPDPGDPYTTLVRGVIGQQISALAAKSIFQKLVDRQGGTLLRPKAILALRAEELRACGLSAPKQRTVLAISEFAVAEQKWIKKAAEHSDEDLRTKLTSVKGIGPWTVDMFLIFGLGRPDVWPVGDLAIRMAAARWWSLPTPTPLATLHTLAEPWRPHRSLAAWFLWQSLQLPPEFQPNS
ncbi:MAG: DNA-3-methyladenine glycosylase family protein [Gemmataceae bacterium]